MNSLTIEIKDNPDLSELAATWQQLTNQCAEPSFFQSWPWVENWLRTYQPDILAVSAVCDSETVAMGLFGKTLERRHKLFSSRQLRLLQTGKADEDQAWVEFNDILAKPGYRDQAWQAMISTLLSDESEFDEIVISMMLRSQSKAVFDSWPKTLVTLDTPRFRTDLRVLASSRQHYLQSLTRNTRYQINRSNRHYEETYGPIRFDFAKNVNQALAYLDEAGTLHRQRWQDSGFDNPKFVELHRKFIENNFDFGRIDMARIFAGKKLIAIIYNILHAKNVYFYLLGLQNESDNKMKPGLTSHALLIEHYLQRGLSYYDFMGGDGQYKQQLSKHDDDFVGLRLSKPHFKFRVEGFGLRLKQLFK